jgi:hypothetical protein
LKLDLLLDSSHGDESEKPLKDIIKLINQAITQTRSLMTDLSPSVLYELGLTEALEWLGEQIQDQHGLKVIVKNDPKIRNIDKDLQVFLFRSTRELLLNAVKHARAKEAYIILQMLPGKISVTVKDNGVSFDIISGAFSRLKPKRDREHPSGSLCRNRNTGKQIRQKRLQKKQPPRSRQSRYETNAFISQQAEANERSSCGSGEIRFLPLFRDNNENSCRRPGITWTGLDNFKLSPRDQSGRA